MVKRFRLYYLVLLFITFLIFLFGLSCTSRNETVVVDGKVTVTFWHSMGRGHSEILKEIIADFEKENPDVRVNAVYQGSYNSLLTNLTASCTAGTNPVMSQMYESWTTRFLNHDLLKPVEELADEYGGLDIEDRKDIPHVFIKDNSWKGKLMTLPFNKSAYILYYNRDAMKEIGLVDESGRGRAPVTWEEFRKACIDLTREIDEGITRYGFGVRPLIEGYTMFLFRAGGDYLDPAEEEVLFTGPRGRKTMEYLYQLVNEDKCAYVEPGYLSSAFGNGRIAMYAGTTASMPYNAKAVGDQFDWGVAPIPYPEEAKDDARTLFQGTNVGIFANHPPKRQEAAWRFLRFLTDTQSAAKWSVGTGYLPIRYSVMETKMMQEYLENNPRYRTPVSLLDNGKFEPRKPIWEPMRSLITDHFEAVVSGRRQPNEAIDQMAEECREIIRTF